MSSTQITTTALLKQFATYVESDEVTITSKLGTSTVSRVRFKRLSYPSSHNDQECFIRSLIEADYPKAQQTLQGMYDKCINDQMRAINNLLEKEGGGLERL
tara:strand:+ start:18154 stop:18456 length:303 start_codon:yes stop_codon:yes gene_type:complete